MAKHTRGATEAAWVIMAGKAKIETEFGKKTLEGIADLIDRKTAAPELLRAALGMVNIPYSKRQKEAYLNLKAALAKAEEG